MPARIQIQDLLRARDPRRLFLIDGVVVADSIDTALAEDFFKGFVQHPESETALQRLQPPLLQLSAPANNSEFVDRYFLNSLDLFKKRPTGTLTQLVEYLERFTRSELFSVFARDMALLKPDKVDTSDRMMQ